MGAHQFSAQVLNELGAMKEVGMHVPDGAIKVAMNLSFMSQYTNMGISECAEMLVELVNIKEHRDDPQNLPESIQYLLKRTLEVLDQADEFEYGLSVEDYVRFMDEIVRICTERKSLALREELNDIPL